MHIPEATEEKQGKGIWRRKILSAKWTVSLICLLAISLIAIFTNYHRTLNASSPTAAKLEPAQPSASFEVSDIEATARSKDKLATKPSIWPASGEVTSSFGWRNSPWGDGRELHPGIDLATSEGTPIVATADGKVVNSGWSGGYGNIIQIEHGNGIETIYGHNSRILANIGESVRKGQVIAYSGNTGRSTGPHLHYEIRVNGTPVDPMSFLVFLAR
jgi:murein DD-endopeptidase MepM/ murein hydrolase activator NlpD